jgi:hypothetical protein
MKRGRTCPKVLKTGYCEKAMQDAARKALEAKIPAPDITEGLLLRPFTNKRVLTSAEILVQ